MAIAIKNTSIKNQINKEIYNFNFKKGSYSNFALKSPQYDQLTKKYYHELLLEKDRLNKVICQRYGQKITKKSNSFLRYNFYCNSKVKSWVVANSFVISVFSKHLEKKMLEC